MITLVMETLKINDVPFLAQLLAEQRQEYIGHFSPFNFDQDSLRGLIENAVDDRYWILRYSGNLAGFFMLRGFDEGFVRPSFGVFVAEQFAGQGLATSALEYALEWCRKDGVTEIMLKVASKNTAAANLYRRFGYRKESECSNTGQDIMVRRVNR